MSELYSVSTGLVTAVIAMCIMVAYFVSPDAAFSAFLITIGKGQHRLALTDLPATDSIAISSLRELNAGEHKIMSARVSSHRIIIQVTLNARAKSREMLYATQEIRLRNLDATTQGQTSHFVAATIIKIGRKL
ncbi:hypothetical protein DXG01_015699 [Tephrocybe rancida]|nr:hypothetical protein DXG01_015699 [Tephrocybe rancida]